MTPVADDRLQRTYRIRVALFLAGTVLLLLLLSYLYQGVQTLNALDQIERERDLWQRPSDVIQALNLHEGSVVVDFGSGVGYFTLKLSPLVGMNGVVVAEDIRQQSLVFLRIRALLRGRHNVKTIRGETGGAFHMLDFEGPEGGTHGLLAHLVHSSKRLKENSASRVLSLMMRTVFANPKKVDRRAMLVGNIAYFRAGV